MQASHGSRVSAVSWAVVALGVMCTLAFVGDWPAPIRPLVALGFLLLGPGLAVTELLGVREPFARIAIATAASLALDTLVALPLVYAGVFSPARALAIIFTITIGIVVATTMRPHESP